MKTERVAALLLLAAVCAGAACVSDPAPSSADDAGTGGDATVGDGGGSGGEGGATGEGGGGGDSGNETGATPTGTFQFSALTQVGLYGGIVTADASGNIVLATELHAQVTLAGKTHPPTGSYGVLVAKLDPTGQNVLWAASYAGANGYHSVSGVSVDSAGTIYVAGSSGSPSIGFGAFTLSNTHSSAAGNFGWIAAFHGNDGSVAWAMTPDFSATDDCYCTAVTARGPLNEIAIACTFSGQAHLQNTSGPYDTFTSNQYDSFVALLDSGSGKAIFDKQITGDSADRVNGVARDSNGDIWFGGESASTAVSDGAGFTLTKPAGALSYGMLAKIAKGAPHTTSNGKAYGGNAASVNGGHLAITKGDGVAWCGTFYGTVDFGTGAKNAAGTTSATQDAVVFEVNPTTGQTIWAMPYGGSFQETCSGLAADTNDDSVIVGGYHGSGSIQLSAGKALGDPPPRGTGVSSAGHVIKIDRYGAVQWTYTVTSTRTGAIHTVDGVATVPGFDKVVYSGHFVGDVDFGNGTLVRSQYDGGVNSLYVVERAP